MKYLFALLLFPITVFGQSVKNDYSDSLAKSNAPQIKLAVTTYLSGKVTNWKDYEEKEWHITSIYNKHGMSGTTSSKEYGNSLKYYIVDFIIRKKGSTDKKDAEVYSFHVLPDFKVRSMIHVSKEPM